MQSYVALMRGINVGKAKRIAMADLRAVFEQLGFSSVKSLLQSGNVVFQSDRIPSPEMIQEAVLERTGVQSMVLVLSEVEFRAAVAADPMVSVAADLSRQVIVFLDRELAPIELPDAASLAPELIAQGSRAFYQWLPNGVLNTKVPTSFWKVVTASGTVTTARNRRTVDKVMVMLDSLSLLRDSTASE